MTNLDISHQMLPAKPLVWRLFGGPQRESFFLTGAYRDLIRNDSPDGSVPSIHQRPGSN
jgi:hypothetical protein